MKMQDSSVLRSPSAGHKESTQQVCAERIKRIPGRAGLGLGSPALPGDCGGGGVTRRRRCHPEDSSRAGPAGLADPARREERRESAPCQSPGGQPPPESRSRTGRGRENSKLVAPAPLLPRALHRPPAARRCRPRGPPAPGRCLAETTRRPPRPRSSRAHRRAGPRAPRAHRHRSAFLLLQQQLVFARKLAHVTLPNPGRI